MIQKSTPDSLISEDAFIRKVIGVPWDNRACTFEAVDCWGLVILYYRHVLGKELHQTPDYESGADFFTCYEGDVVFWRRSDVPVNGGIFLAYTGSAPAHVGLIVNHRALHSRGEGGGVRMDSLLVLQRAFTRLEYFLYGKN